MAEQAPREVDENGDPIDPSRNVWNLVAAAIKRQDDLREMGAKHNTEIGNIRAHFYEALREAEAARIDAIRAVDVGNVQRAAEVQAAQAATLATQVATSAETLRTQVAAAASASAIALAAALEPVQKDIADLRRAQYEAQGQKTQVVESRAGISSTTQIIGAIVAVIVIALTLYATRTKTPTVPALTPTVTVTTPAP